MTEKLETQLETVEIKQTRGKVKPIRFRDDAINKIRKDNYNLGKKRFKFIPFKVSKDSHQKVMKRNWMFMRIILFYIENIICTIMEKK